MMFTRCQSSRDPRLWILTSLAALCLASSAGCSGNGDASGTLDGAGGAAGQNTGGAAGEATGGTGGVDAGSTCGNGLVEGTEECDDGNLTNGDGCENDCSFTCILGTARDHCDDGNPCNGTETCGADHACAPGTPLGNGDVCDGTKICVSGNCVEPTCGDGIVSGTEECDDGNSTSGDGCEPDCAWSCVSTDPARNCASADPCVGDGTCNDASHTCTAGTSVQDGSPCGSAQICVGGNCVAQQCGDGFVSAGEDCDFGPGANTAGSGCEPTCVFSCTTSPDSCDDGNPCNGTEACAQVSGPNGTSGQACVPGTPLADNTTCGVGSYCKAGVCTAAVCGNGTVEPGEQCDDGNPVNGDGCDTDCTYSCVTASTDCTSTAPACDMWQCNSTSHTCEAVTDPSKNGTSCPGGTGYTCKNGTCSAPAAVCGNGVKETGEACDLGAANGTGQGCSSSCQLDCTTNADCADANVCDGTETCVAATVNGQSVMKCQVGTPAADGTACGTGAICLAAQCKNSICGDGFIDTAKGEACDLGATNGTGQGCSSSCQLDCTTNADCSDGNVCNGAETCVAATVSGQSVMKCQAAANAAKCTACTGGLCDGAGQCTASTCGDGCVDASKGEACDPPNGTTCSATCQKAAVCGNGLLEAGEQCDDGNLFNLDGCDSSCKYEALARMTSLSIQGTAAPSYCTPTTNRLGTQSLTSTALSSINQSMTDAINAGTTNILTQFLGLDDLTGVADPNGLTLGILSSSLDPAKGTWPTTNPIDWWFIADHTALSSAGLPTGLLTNGTLAARALAAGPNDVNLIMLLGGSTANLRMRSARISATINGTPAPNVPAPPPAQLAAGLTVFQTITASGTGQGLCGNITVESLAQIPIPQSLAQGGSTACGNCTGSKTYTYCGEGQPVGPGCNSLLDSLVGGCKVVMCFVTAINARQPDVPATTGGTVKTLTLGTGNKVPASQTTGNNDAYSAYMKFDANRAHITGEDCTVTTDCQTGKTCVSGKCQ